MNEDRYQATSVKRAAPDASRPDRFCMEVVWRDQRRSLYPWGYLRAICPCANCRLQVISRVQTDAANATDCEATRIAQLQHIGHYALGIVWQDAHQMILPWDYLRALDPDESTVGARVAYLKTDKRLL
ncbi:MAG: DUF971 domain-containing protein [Planctomycetota bacterium]